MELLAREASPSDIPELARVGSATFWDAYGGTAPDENIAIHVQNYFSADAITAEFDSPDVCYFLASCNGELAGLVKMRFGEVPDTVDAKSAVEVQQLYVSPDHQRKGVGEFLINVVREETSRRGADGIWLSVWTEADWATAFYLKVGFEEAGTAPFMLADIEYVDYIMWMPVRD